MAAANALGIGAASFASFFWGTGTGMGTGTGFGSGGASKDIAESPTAQPERPKK